MNFKIKIRLVILLISIFYSVFGFSNAAINLICEYKVNPKGIETLSPRLSWQLQSKLNERGLFQTAYQIQVATKKADLVSGNNLIWDTDKTDSDQSIQIEYSGSPLKAKQIYFWRVKIWDNLNGENDWSGVASWEMSLLNHTNWKANWIEPNLEEKEKAYNPCPILRRTFKSKNKVEKARLYISAKGLYECYINEQRVGEAHFTPGWTNYNKRIQYQTYDVTKMIQEKNAIAVRLGDGWFRGQFDSYDRWNNNYGQNLALIFQLEIYYENGQTEIISSDKKWKSSTGAVIMSGVYDGETYDAHLEKKGWMTYKYSDKNWSTVNVINESKELLTHYEGVPVKKMETLKPKKIFQTPKGETVLDMGQNMVGWMKVKAKGLPGDTITLHHAEVLDQEGNFYTANLRTADQSVQYILDEKKEYTLEPHFTFQGFRYVKIEGTKSDLSLDNFEGAVIYSAMKQTGTFECSNEKINQLQSNIQWGQKGNFLDIPMDCPQRDERMGWTGDAQVFCRTACFNYDASSFFTRWLQDLKLDQLENGSVPWAIPDVLKRNGSAGWGDAATIIPWTLYLKYRDLRILERQYDSMKSWVGFLGSLSEGNFVVTKGFHFGDWNFFIHPSDWNDKPGYTDKDFIATAFYAHSTNLTLQAAKLLGNEKDVKHYTRLLKNIKVAFQTEFMTPTGRLSPHSQTAYTLALTFDLLPEKQRKYAVEYLVKDIEARKYHLSTGFLGTPHLCHALSENGYTDIAYKLLLQESHPSWLYPINKGATTFWERWDGIKPDGTFQDVKANSFNHYAYGAIGDWLYRVVAGIEIDEEKPGYKNFIIQPQPNDTLSYAKASYESMYGKIKSEWKWEQKEFELNIEIPPNTTASVKLPFLNDDNIEEVFELLKKESDDVDIQVVGNKLFIKVGSGKYRFAYAMRS